MGCLFMPWSRSENLKIRKFKIIPIKKFCQKLKVFLFCFINCERQPISGCLLCIVNAKTVQPLVLWVAKVFVTCVRLQTKQRKKNQNFWFMEKHLSYNFHLWKNVYHRDLTQFSVRMELYDKKFLIYGNCMIRSSVHSGQFSALLNIFPFSALLYFSAVKRSQQF